VTIASVRVQGDPDDTEPLIEAHAAADEAGDAEEATRALSNLGFSLLFWMRPEPARVHLEHALEYARAHERENLASYAATTLAWLRLRAGEWAEAERIVRSQETTGATVPQLVAATVLVELAVRRGDADATARLSALAAQADRAGDLQRTLPVFELEVERAVTGGGELPHLRLERLAAEIRSHSARRHWGSARLAAWAAVAGIDLDLGLDASFREPFAAMIERDWRKAADAYGRAGWTYDQALMLSLLDEPDALAQALETARALGAAPLARRVTSRMRKRGFTVPRGPRVSTRRNPVGLTARQLEVLALLLDGLTNGEIAHRLIVSPRTAEHHVAAVLGKLGAASRKDAKRRASELGVEVGVN